MQEQEAYMMSVRLQLPDGTQVARTLLSLADIVRTMRVPDVQGRSYMELEMQTNMRPVSLGTVRLKLEITRQGDWTRQEDAFMPKDMVHTGQLYRLATCRACDFMDAGCLACSQGRATDKMVTVSLTGSLLKYHDMAHPQEGGGEVSLRDIERVEQVQQDCASFFLVFKNGGRVLTFAVPTNLGISAMDANVDMALERERAIWLHHLRLGISQASLY